MGSWWPWCRHKWVVREEFAITRTGDLSKEIVAYDKHLQCEKCGDWKRVRL